MMNKREDIIILGIFLFFIFLVGINALSIGGESGSFYDGQIDEVRIYNGSLSSEEVRSNYELDYINWDSWSKLGYLEDLVPVRSPLAKFLQFKFLLESNDTEVSPSVLNYTTKSAGSNLGPSILLVRVNSSYGTNYTDENLYCYVNITDSDDSNVYANFTWYNDTGAVFSGEYGPFSIDTLTLISILESGNTSKYENWTCSVKAYDGKDYENNESNASITILNKPPEVNLSYPLDDFETTNRTPTFNWTGSDADGDPITYELNISCFHSAGGTCSIDDRYFTNLILENKTLEEYLKYLWDKNYYYNWTVRANDSEDYGEWAPPRRLKIQALIATSLPVDFVDFGEMEPEEINDTSDDNPSPLELQNDGNCFVNTTINATDLWSSENNPSEYYLYKIDNKTGEEGAFVWDLSEVSWINMPSINSLAIAKLDWNDSKDLAETDLKVKVPNHELPGNKTSTIWFISSLGE